jgi:hypothetical protein
VPPIGESWPLEPRKHIIWIDDFGDIASRNASKVKNRAIRRAHRVAECTDRAQAVRGPLLAREEQVRRRSSCQARVAFSEPRTGRGCAVANGQMVVTRLDGHRPFREKWGPGVPGMSATFTRRTLRRCRGLPRLCTTPLGWRGR